MKIKHIFLAVSLCVSAVEISAQNTQVTENQNEIKKSVFSGMQEKIEAAFGKSFALQNLQEFDLLESQIIENQSNENLKNYWLSYLYFYKSIYFLKMKNQEKARDFLTQSIDILQNTKTKTAEDYALLVNEKSLFFPFLKSQAELMKNDAEIKSLLEKGFKLNKENPRLLAVAGIYDAQTPKEYGGGKKAEKYLLKALSVKDKNLNNSELPRWGKEQAYEFLIQFYIAENQKDKAKLFLEKFKTEFPQNHSLKKLESLLK